MSYEYIQLDSLKADNSSNFQYTLSKEITISEGDIISLQSAYLDTRENSSGNIILDEDVEISMSFYFYIIDNNIRHGQVNPITGQIIDGNGNELPNNEPEKSLFGNFTNTPYILKIYGKKNGVLGYHPVIGTFKYTIKRGSYPPSILAEELSKRFQSGDINSLLLKDSHLLTFPEQYTDGRKYISPFLCNLWNASKITTDTSEAYNFQTLDPRPTNLSFTNLPNYSMCGNMPLYDSDDIQPTIYRKYYFDRLISGMTTVNPPFILNEADSIYNSYLIGSDSVNLQYDGSKFILGGLHTPLRVSGKNVVAMIIKRPYKINTPDDLPELKYEDFQVGLQTAFSGLLLHDLQPRSFWQGKLKFNVDNMTVDLDKTPLITIDQFNNATTRTLWTIDNLNANELTPNGITRGINLFFNQGYPALLETVPTVNSGFTYNFPTGSGKFDMRMNPNCIPSDPNMFSISGSPSYDKYQSYMQVFEQDAEVSINANNYISQDFGHYLLEIDFYKNKFCDETAPYNISAIIGKYYNVDSYVNGNIQNSLNYVHSGLPIIFTTAHVRILDPNKRVSNLGSSNFIYLQVLHKSPNDQATETEKEKNK